MAKTPLRYNVDMAEWLCRGLQTHLLWFDSGYQLQDKALAAAE